MKTKDCVSVVTLSLIALILMWGLSASAQDLVAQQPTTSAIPNLIRYSGVLKDADGTVLASQTVGITFALYKQQDGGVALWTETRNITTDAAGQYNVMLGSTKTDGVPAELFSDQEQRWLAVQVQGQPEPTRVLLVSVPYAFKAHEAETLGGLPPSAFVKVAPDASGTGSTDEGITVNALNAPGNSGSTRSPSKMSPSLAGPCAAPVTGYIPYWSPAPTLCNSMIYQTGAGFVGISTATPSKQLDVNGEINARKWYDIGLPVTPVLSISYPSPNFGLHDLFVGVGAGISDTTGHDNTFSGYQACNANIGGTSATDRRGSYNTCSGSQAGLFNTFGYDNTFTGYTAGYGNITGYQNSCFGSAACLHNLTGIENVAIGAGAGFRNTGGNANVYVGFDAGWGTSIGSNGSDNTIVGFEAGFANAADNNTFVGYEAGITNTSGGFNTFVGSDTGVSNNTGSANTYLGRYAGYSNQTGTNNVMIGNSAGFANTGGFNTFVGSSAGDQFTTGNANTFVGNSAGVSVPPGSSSNTFVGARAGASTLGGPDMNNNSFFGEEAGANHYFGDGNTYLGFRSGFGDTMGTENTLAGSQSGFGGGGGLGNTYVGFRAGFYKNSGEHSYNTFVGDRAGEGTFVNSGALNSFFGYRAGAAIDAGAGNTFLGNEAGAQFGGGNNNICVGSRACYAETAADNNIEIGNSGPAIETAGDNQILIGNATVQTDAYIAGIYGALAGTAGSFQSVCVDSNGKLWGVSALANCITSSRRFKEQIADMGDSTRKLLQLRPVTFFYKPQYDDGSHSPQFGLIAEEVAKVYPEMVVYDKEGQPYTVKYQLLAPMLLNEFQKQHAVVTAQQTEMQALREQTKAQQQQMVAQQQEIEGLKSQLQLQNAAFQERLSRLESLVATQLQTAADKPIPIPATTPGNGGLQ